MDTNGENDRTETLRTSRRLAVKAIRQNIREHPGIPPELLARNFFNSLNNELGLLPPLVWESTSQELEANSRASPQEEPEKAKEAQFFDSGMTRRRAGLEAEKSDGVNPTTKESADIISQNQTVQSSNSPTTSDDSLLNRLQKLHYIQKTSVPVGRKVQIITNLRDLTTGTSKLVLYDDLPRSSTVKPEPKNTIRYFLNYIGKGNYLIETVKDALNQYLAVCSVEDDKKRAETEFEDYEMTVEFYISKAERNLRKLENNKDINEDHLLKIHDFPAPFSKVTWSKMEESQLLNSELIRREMALNAEESIGVNSSDEEPACTESKNCAVQRSNLASTSDESLDLNELQKYDYSSCAPIISPWSASKPPAWLIVYGFLDSLRNELEIFKSGREEEMKNATLEIQHLLAHFESYKFQWRKFLRYSVDCNDVKRTEAEVEEQMKEADLLLRKMLLEESNIDKDVYDHYMLKTQKSPAALSEVTCFKREEAQELQSHEEKTDEEEDLGLFFMSFDTTYF